MCVGVKKRPDGISGIRHRAEGNLTRLGLDLSDRRAASAKRQENKEYKEWNHDRKAGFPAFANVITIDCRKSLYRP